nr:MAG TPA: PolyVal ADP-Ribosyltransferase [Crassvirales sp.]
MIDDVITGDDFLDKLTKGPYQRNPAYNPKTKAGKLQPPVLVNTDAGNLHSGSLTESADRINKIRFTGADLGLTNEEIEKRGEDGFTVSAYDTEADINQAYARRQSAFAKWGNMAVRAGLGEVVLGSLAGVGNILDGFINWGTEDNYYQNPWTKFFTGLKEDADEKFKIYRENPDKSFDVSDAGWWADNMVNVFTTLSLLIPAGMWAKGASLAGKATGASKLLSGASRWTSKAIAKGLVKTADATNKANTTMQILRKAGKIDKTAKGLGEISATALFSRTGENQMEGQQTYEEVYDSNIAKLNDMDNTEFNKFIARHEEFKGKSKEDIANTIAARAAKETFKKDYWMLLMDIPQFYTLGSIWGKTLSRNSTAAERIAVKNAKAKLAGATEDKLIKNNLKNRIKEHFSYGFTHPTSTLIVNELGEGVEEGLQGITQEKGKEVAERYFNPKYANRTLDSYLSDPSIWEQAFWGWVGGIAFGPSANLVRNAAHRAEGYYKHKKGKLTDAQYEQWNMSQDKIVLKQLENITSISDRFIKQKELIEQGKNPFVTKKDSNGNPIFVRGQVQYEDLTTESDKEEAQSLAIKQLTDETIFEALDNGSYDLFKEILDSNEFAKYLKDKAPKITETDDALRKQVVDRMNTIEGLYHRTATDVNAIVEDDNPFIVKAMARQIARDNLSVADYETQMNQIAKEIYDNNGSSSEYNKYKDDIIKNYVERKYNVINNQIDNITTDDSYSDAAKQYAIQELKKQQKALIQYASDNISTSFAHITDASGYLSISLNDIYEGDQVVPEYTIRELEETKHELGTEQALLKASIPFGEQEYKDRYDSYARSMSKYTMKKIDAYIKLVEDYLRNESDIDDAVNKIMNGRADNKKLKDAIDYLRYGLQNYSSNEAFIGQSALNKKLSDIINKIKKERNKNESIAKEAEEEGTPIVTSEEVSEKEDDAAEDDASKEKEKEEPVIIEPSHIEEATGAEEKGAEENESEEGATESPSSTGGETGTGTVVAENPADTESNGSEVNDSETHATSEVEKVIAEEGKSDEGTIAKDTPNIYERAEEEIVSDDQAEVIQAIDEGTNTERFRAELVASEHIAIIGLTNPARIKEIADAYEQGDTSKYDALIKEVVDKIRKKYNGVSEKTAEDIAKTQFRVLSAQFAAMDNKSPFAKLANKLAIIQKYVSDTSLISNEEQNKVIDDFLEEYNKAVNNATYKDATGQDKYVINIQNLFSYILNNENIDQATAKYIYDNLSKYISNANNGKYLFTGFYTTGQLLGSNEFFDYLNSSKATSYKKDNLVHISPIEYDQRDKNYDDAIIAAANGAKTYIKLDPGYGGSSNLGVYVKTKKGDVKIGILRSVNLNKDGNGYTRRSHYSGFSNNITKNGETYTLDCDFLFDALIDYQNRDEQTKELFNMLLEYCFKRDEITVSRKSDTKKIEAYEALVTKEGAKKLLENPLIKRLLEERKYKFYRNIEESSAELDDLEKARQLINSITNVLFYKNKFYETSPVNNRINDFFTDVNDMRESYENWKVAVYTNYENTYAYEEALIDDNTTVDISINIDSYYKLNTIADKSKYVNIGDNSFELDKTSKNYTPLVIVNNEGRLIDEEGNDLGRADNNISPFSIGFIVHDEDGKKFVAYCNTAQDIKNSKLGEAVKGEIIKLITKQLLNVDSNEHADNFYEIAESLNELIGVGGIFKIDYRIISMSSNGSILTISQKTIDESTGNVKYAPFISFHRTKGDYINGKIVGYSNSNAITLYNVNGQEKVVIHDINDLSNAETRKLIDEAIDKALPTIKINRSMQSITGKTKEGGTTKYINREGGKFNLTINGTTTSYENFGDFIIQSRAFTTNVANKRGSFGSKITNFERLSIDTNIRDTSKDVGANNTNVTDLVNDAVNKAAKSKKNTVAIKTSDVLEAAGVEQKQIDVLTGNTTGFPIVTTEIEYDKNSSTEDDSITNAYYSPKDKKIHLTAKGAFSMNANPRNAIRLLLHENIHKHFHNGRNYSKKQRERIIDELKEVYEYTLEQLANDKANGVISEQLYNGIIEVFNISTKNKDDVVAMEEFLTECLTQPVLIEYLNNTKYKEAVNIDGIPQQSKSILQKIMDILLDLFGINADRIKNNSILAREYAILSKTNSRTDAGLFAKEYSGLSEKTKSDNVKLPVEETSKSKSAPSPVTPSSAPASKEQTTNKKLKAIEDRINNMRNGFSERIVRSENFEEDHTYYLDGEKVDTSVTEAVHGKRDLEEWGLPASALGNSADGTARTYFQYNGAIPDNYVVPNATPEQRRRFIENLDALKEYLDNRFGIGKYKVITDEFPIGGVIHTAKGDVTVAGTMDMLVFDEAGNLYIFDFKTKRDSGTGSDLSDYTKEGYDQQVNIYRQLIEANYPEFKGKVHIGGLIKFAVEYPKPTKDNYRMSPDKKGQLQYRPYPDMDYADIQIATNEYEYEFPYFYSDKSVESQILSVEIKDYKDAISALPEKKVDKSNAANDVTNDDIIDGINLILDDMYDEDTSDIDTDDLNADDLNANTNLIEDETNYTAEEQHILNTAKRNKEGKLLASNGKVSNLTEKQYAQVRTKAFKEWFGDWEKAANANRVSLGKEIPNTDEYSKYGQKGETDIEIREVLDEKGNIIGTIRMEFSGKGRKGVVTLHPSLTVTGKGYGTALYQHIADTYNINVEESFGEIGKSEAAKKLWNKIANTISKDPDIPLRQLTPSNSSKVIDENGEPLVVYRGTRPNSTVYNTGIFRSKILFATPKKVGASRYGEPIALFMNARNPAIIDYKGEEYDRKIEDEFYTPGNSFTIIDRKAEVAINKGYDALIVKNVKDGTNYPIDDYVVLNPNQIKSATDNIGTFSRTDNNIYHANTNLLTTTEIYANPIADGATDNAYGVRLVNDMDSFVRSFPEQYRGDIEHLMARDEIEYSCM